MAVVAVWGLASCTDADMPALTTYDAQESLGTWVSENTDDGTTYYVALSLKKTVVPAAEDGAQPTVKVDTIGTLYMTDGTDTYVAANGTLSYDAKVGMSTLDFANTPFRSPMHVYLARQTSKTRMSVQLFIYEVYQGKVYEQKLIAFNGIPSKGVAIAGESLFWGNADGTFYIQFTPMVLVPIKQRLSLKVQALTPTMRLLAQAQLPWPTVQHTPLATMPTMP